VYARLLTFEGADASAREEAERTIRTEVLPLLHGMDGFAGYVALWNADERDARAITFWETREAAESSEQELAPRRTEGLARMGMTVRGNELFEAPIVELAAARV
jgi:heme-degrading monooxygenase HmoA